MARIRDADIAAVRDQARLDDVARDVMALQPAGGGSFKGLCPFHDERTPSFHINPDKGVWYCFGCGEGGDTIDFVERVDGVSFMEAIEKLADRFGVHLHYEQGSAATPRQAGKRSTLVAVNAMAADFFQRQLSTPGAQPARDFLQSRHFDPDSWTTFGVGFAPQGWSELTKYLRSRGVADEDAQTAGLLIAGDRGPYDRFRGRVIWPIRDTAGDVIGFGARKLFDDDQGPKYLNTPETPIYKKSRALYGINLARKSMTEQRQAVIVEGYTDVMACHLAGVTTAVATCGTAFGEGHVGVLRRVMLDTDQRSGEIIFTFDGDAAGQRAALRALDTDNDFVAQTYVAVDQQGGDPCDVRLAAGDQAVVDLVASRTPLVDFALRATIRDYDLSTAEGRVNAVHAASKILSRMSDSALQRQYVHTVAGWVGVDPHDIRVDAAHSSPPPTQQAVAITTSLLEKQAIHALIQCPRELAEWLVATEPSAFTDPTAVEIFQLLLSSGAPSEGDSEAAWLERVVHASSDARIRHVIQQLAVEPLPVSSPDQRSAYAEAILARLHAADVGRRLGPLKAHVARLEGTEHVDEYTAVLRQLMELESYRRELLGIALGESG